MRSGMLLLCAAAAVTACRQAPPAASGVSMHAYASTQEVIDAIVAPDGQALFDAVAYENGQLTRAPRTDDQWNRLKLQALAVAEAGNLLMMPPRAKDDGAWKADAHAMSEKAAAAAAAAAAKDPDRLLEAGGELYETCTACHMTYGPKDD